MQFLDLKQGSPEWLAFRKMKIGSSMAGTIMGVNPYETPLQLYESIIHGKEKEVTHAMQMGKEFEPIAREWYCKRVEREVVAAPTVQSIKYPWRFSSLDFWDDYLKVPGEIKVPVNFKVETIPDMYYAQVQHHLAVSKSEWGFYIPFDRRKGEGVIFEIKADKEYQEELFEKELAFYECLINYDPPPETQGDRMMITDDAILDKLNHMKRLSERMKSDQNHYDSIKEEVIQSLPHDRILIDGIKVTKIVRAGAIQYSAIPQLKGIDLQNYRKPPTTSWRFDFN